MDCLESVLLFDLRSNPHIVAWKHNHPLCLSSLGGGEVVNYTILVTKGKKKKKKS